MNTTIAKKIVYPLIGLTRGEKTIRTLNRIRHIPTLSRSKIDELNKQKLTRILCHAQNHIPYYQKRYKELGIQTDQLNFPQDLPILPIIDKKTVLEYFEQFNDPNSKVRTSREVTSGTSGHPLLVIKDRQKSAHIRAVMFRCYEQYGVSYGDKQIRFWGVPTNRKSYYIEKFKDALANRIRLSAFDVSRENMRRFYKSMFEFKPRYFYGYPSVLARFAQWIQEEQLPLNGLNLSVIISTGEVLYPSQRERIENTFQCKVANEYGTTEAGVLAFECPKGRMHINMDHVLLQVLPVEDRKNLGRIIITELNNSYNPLIRYDLGDIGTLSNESCTCGNHFPVLNQLQGRDSTFIVTPEDNYINDGILEYILRTGVQKFQGIQHSQDSLIIKIVKNRDYTERLHQSYQKHLVNYLGKSIHIDFQFVDDIPVEKSGKFRYFISTLL